MEIERAGIGPDNEASNETYAKHKCALEGRDSCISPVTVSSHGQNHGFEFPTRLVAAVTVTWSIPRLMIELRIAHIQCAVQDGKLHISRLPAPDSGSIMYSGDSTNLRCSTGTLSILTVMSTN